MEQIAVAGAAALVGAMATDTWHLALSGFMRLLGRGDSGKQELAKKRLSAAAAEVEQVAEPDREGLRQELLPAWRVRLEDLLEEYPEVREELRVLTDRLRNELPHPQQTWVMLNLAREHGSVYAVQGGSQYVDRHGASPRDQPHATDDAQAPSEGHPTECP